MTTLQFPANPVLNQEYDYPPYKYYWDGQKWKTKGVGYNPVNDLRNEVLPTAREAIKRSYAEAGFNLVAGSFEDGGVLTSVSDVLLHKESGIAYSWGGIFPQVVASNSTPTPLGSDGWIDRSNTVLRNELVGDSGATYIGYKGSFTNSTRRTVAQKAADLKSLKDWGVTGDGVTIDRAKIQKAIDDVHAAGGGTIWCPDGTYLLDAVNYIKDDGVTVYGITSIKLKDGVYLAGNRGAVFKVKNDAYGPGAFYRAFSSGDADRLKNAGLYGITIDGNASGNIASTQCSNIVLECDSNVTIMDVESKASNGNGIMLRGTTTNAAKNLAVINCVIATATSTGIQCSQFNGLRILGNQVSYTTDNCIDIYGEDGDTYTNGINFIVANNIVRNGLVGIFCETVAHGTVANNSVYACTSIGLVVNRINGQPINVEFAGNKVLSCPIGARVTGDTGGVFFTNNTFAEFSAAGITLGASGNCSYVFLEGNMFIPVNNTTAIINSAAAVLSFCRGKRNKVISNGIVAAYLFSNAATTTVGTVIDSFEVLPNQVGNDLKATDPQFSKVSTYSGAFFNVSGTQTFTPDDNTGGLLFITAYQGGVGKSTWVIPYTKYSGTLVLGTAQKAIITADPISSVTAGSGSVDVALLAANSYVKYGIQNTPF